MTVLLILKIIGLILAGLIALLLFVLMLLCLVPITYRVSIGKDAEVIKGEGRAGWLFGIVRAAAVYTDKKTSFKILLFGIDLLKKDNKKTKDTSEEKKTDQKKEKKSVQETADKESIKNEKKEIPVKTVSSGKTEEKVIKTAADQKMESEKETKRKIKGPDKKKKKKKSLKDRIKIIFNRIRQIKDTAADIKDKLSTEQAKKAIKHLLNEFLNILGHIRPRRSKGILRIGLDTPDQTALAYAVSANIMQIVLGGVEVLPDMENKIFDFNVKISGRIILGYFAVVIARLLLDSNVTGTIKGLRRKQNG